MQDQGMKIIEAVPNVSAGADPQVVERLVAAAHTGNPDTRGAVVAHVDTSISANRTVITLFGQPAAVVASCSALVATAAETITMRTHHGTHPCIGAVDVAPFIPMGTATMDDAIACAREFAQWAANTYQVPTFLYGEAATRARYQSLPFLRRGGLQGLEERLSRGDITPDYGPATVHPSLGALITGARPILIAYNIQLSTSDPIVAHAIAREVRSSGPTGRPWALPALRAIGWYEEAHGCAEVSCNLLDYKTTGLLAVWEQVTSVAAHYRCTTISSDIIGLAPADAFAHPVLSPEEYRHHLCLGICRSFDPDTRIIEEARNRAMRQIENNASDRSMLEDRGELSRDRK